MQTQFFVRHPRCNRRTSNPSNSAKPILPTRVWIEETHASRIAYFSINSVRMIIHDIRNEFNETGCLSDCEHLKVTLIQIRGHLVGLNVHLSGLVHPPFGVKQFANVAFLEEGFQ